MESLFAGFRRRVALRRLVRLRVLAAGVHAHREPDVQQRHREDLHRGRRGLRDPRGVAGFLHGDYHSYITHVFVRPLRLGVRGRVSDREFMSGFSPFGARALTVGRDDRV